MRRVLASIALAALLSGPAAAALGARPAGPAGPASGPPRLGDAKAWVLIDPRDDVVLAAEGQDRRLPIASTTKLMTAYLALERLEPRLMLRAPRYEAEGAESLLGLRVGERLSVRDLLYALVLQSANDAAETLANGVAGSVPAFVKRMNAQARRLGLSHTHYSNPVGLDEPGNYSSARDLASLADKLLRKPLFAKIADSSSVTLTSGDHPRHIVTRNLLLDDEPFVAGVKTGHTLDAGYVLVGSGEKHGTTLISAVLGAPSQDARDADTLTLLRYGFSQYMPSTPVSKGERIASPSIEYGSGQLELDAARTLEVYARRGQRFETRVRAPAQVSGPIAKGQELGRVSVRVGGRLAGSAPLVATEAVAAATVFQKAISTLLNPILFLPLGLIVIVLGVFLLRRDRHHGGPPPPRLPRDRSRRDRSRNDKARTAEERERMREQRMHRRRDQETEIE